jgi:hypothetical protein
MFSALPAFGTSGVVYTSEQTMVYRFTARVEVD